MRESGFTLLELLVAMTLLALLSLVLFGGFRFGTRAWDRAEDSTARGNEIRRAQDDIGTALTRAYPEMDLSDPRNPHIFFSGEMRAVTFLAPDRARPGSLDVTTLSRQGDALVMTLTPELARNPAAQTVRRKLLDHVTGFELGYFGAARPGDPPRWNASWHDRGRLPRLIRIRAALDKARPGWTEMIVVPRIQADVNCTFDPLTKFCQGR
ncbi:MAG TPA: prepilin-type N-terminal cleavage/methylation domain-containing protein [Rhizomicrobium sp.]|nr:prepilin-type N-terminal cleavage/methylation domain-containing protein [Rhizomicrobium sp.]